MTLEKRLELIGVLDTQAREILKQKGLAYAGTGDTLANFKRNAERLGLTKYQVWAVYFFKHIDSIGNAVQQCPGLPVDTSEGMTSRIIDAKNYLDILYCLIMEDTEPHLNFQLDQALLENGKVNL